MEKIEHLAILPASFRELQMTHLRFENKVHEEDRKTEELARRVEQLEKVIS